MYSIVINSSDIAYSCRFLLVKIGEPDLSTFQHVLDFENSMTLHVVFSLADLVFNLFHPRNWLESFRVKRWHEIVAIFNFEGQVLFHLLNDELIESPIIGDTLHILPGP